MWTSESASQVALKNWAFSGITLSILFGGRLGIFITTSSTCENVLCLPWCFPLVFHYFLQTGLMHLSLRVPLMVIESINATFLFLKLRFLTYWNGILCIDLYGQPTYNSKHFFLQCVDSFRFSFHPWGICFQDPAADAGSGSWNLCIPFFHIHTYLW